MAQVNTDVITIVVVISAVFWIKSLAIYLLLILYLSYFWRVHNKILNELKEKQIVNKIEQSMQ
jgi:hypothetical protein